MSTQPLPAYFHLAVSPDGIVLYGSENQRDVDEYATSAGPGVRVCKVQRLFPDSRLADASESKPACPRCFGYGRVAGHYGRPVECPDCRGRKVLP